MKFCGDRKCERAGQLLETDQFYEKLDAADQLDPYCKRCRSRRAREHYAKKIAGEFRRNRRSVQRKPMILAKSEFALSLVYDAVNSGCRTREEIHRATKLPYDDIGDALLELWEVKGLRIERLSGGQRTWHTFGEQAA